MKSFTKLAVLLLTLALLCTSVFAVTVFADETATVSTSAEDDHVRLQIDAENGAAVGVGEIANNSSANGRHGEGTYRDYTEGSGHIFTVVNRDPVAEGDTKTFTSTNTAQFQYTLTASSGNTMTASQYFVYDFELGTNSHFFKTSANKSLVQIIIGGGKNDSLTGTPSGRSFYIRETGSDADGWNAVLSTSDASGVTAQLGLIGENGLSVRLSFVLEMNATTQADSKIYVFANGSYVTNVTLGYSETVLKGPRARIAVIGDKTNTVDQSLYIDSAAMYEVSSGSSAAIAGDLAALCDMSELGVPVAIDQSHLFTLDETALVNDADTYAVKVAVDNVPEAYALYSMSGIRGVFNLGADVALTLLEDLTITSKVQYDTKQAGTYGGFSNITQAGKKTFNLNGHTFSHLPLSYGPSGFEIDGVDTSTVALPGRGQTFLFGVTDIEFVINGADADGNNGKMVKVSSANDFFKQNSDSVTYTNLVVSDVDFDITGSGFFGKRSTSTFDASFTDCNFAFTAGVGRFQYVNSTLQDAGRTNYTNWDTVNTTPSLSAGGLSTKDALFSFINCNVDFTSSYANVTVTGGDVLIGNCSNSTVTVTDARTRLNRTATITNSEITVTGGSFYNTGNVSFVTGSKLTLNGISESAYEGHEEGTPMYLNAMDFTDSTLVVTDSVLTHSSFISLWADSDATFENCDIVLTTTFMHVKKDIDADGTHGDNYTERTDEGYADNIGSSSTVKFTACRFSNGNEKNNSVVGTYPAVVTMDAGCKATEAYILNNQVYTITEDYYITNNDGEDAATYPYVIKEFSYSALAPVANLTLYSDIQFNLLLPYATTANYITAVDGTALAELETVTDAEGNIIYYCVPYTVAAHAANEAITVSFNPVNKGNAKYTLTKTISIPEYIGLVYADANNSDSWALMSDLVDYVAATMTHFDATADVSAFTTLQGNANYVNNTNTEITGETVDYSAVAGYIEGAYLNVEASNTKFVFVAGTADKVTLSYTSLTEGEVIKTFENCAEGDKLVLEMRAYDLNAVITISVNDGAATGTYDLAAYAKEATEAADVLREMYNYAKSAEAYKKSLLEAENN